MGQVLARWSPSTDGLLLAPYVTFPGTSTSGTLILPVLRLTGLGPVCVCFLKYLLVLVLEVFESMVLL